MKQIAEAFFSLEGKMRYLKHMQRALHNYGLQPSMFGKKGIVLYVLVKLLKPSIVVETGVEHGVSTSFILMALEDNNYGKLFSIDIPSNTLPKRKVSGWLIPEGLKQRWSLLIGRSKDILKPLLSQLSTIDIFFHDSEHTYYNMLYEYLVAYQHLREGGILLSDDVSLNKAFFDFCAIVHRKPIRFSFGLGGISV